MNRLTGAIAALAIVTATQLWAIDIVTRKSDGKQVSGAITSMSKTEITLKKAVGEPDVVQANDVAKIEWDGAPPDLKLGYSDENGGRLDAAVAKYTKSKTDAKSPTANLSAEFDYILARVHARIALADPTKQAAAVQQLIAVQKAHPEHFRYYESVSMLGRLQLEMGEFDAARTTFGLLAKSPWSDYKLAAKIAAGRILVAENKLDEAVVEFEAAAAAATDSRADQARKYEARLGQARALVAQSKFEDALKILDLVTDKGPTDDSAVQAEGYVLQGHCLQSLGRMKEAALAYLHVDILFPQETDYHAEALFNLVKTWKSVQLPDRSAEAEAKLVQKYPDSAWRKKLAAN